MGTDLRAICFKILLNTNEVRKSQKLPRCHDIACGGYNKKLRMFRASCDVRCLKPRQTTCDIVITHVEIGYGLFLQQCYKLSIYVQSYIFPVVKYKYDTKQPSSCNKLGVLQDVEPICITWIFVVWWEKNYSVTNKFEKLHMYSLFL
jgi:hypothetical protein